MSFIEIEHVTHCYQDDQKALDDVSYSIEKGELFALLGSSGCGKSTLLNIIGGFLDPTEGFVKVEGRDILGLPPYERNIGMVFQNYALFPHMTVFDNVAYGLTIQKKSKEYIRARVEECLDLVHLTSYEQRMPNQLSGGQQQRVAIARALANNPEILMLDEPMGNLDAKLRKEMQVELRSIQKRTGITTIMVTHDQEEAMTMSDRIGIMRFGVVQQVGTPPEVYGQPANSFVAGFLGETNLTHVESRDGFPGFVSTDWIKADGEPVRFVDPHYVGDSRLSDNKIVVIRPENIVTSFTPRDGHVPVSVRNVVYIGSSVRITATFEGGGDILLDVSTCQMEALPENGQKMFITWHPQDALCIEDVGDAK